MLRRPKPTDSEEDLLKEQERFLTSGAPAAAAVLRRPDKRRGQNGENGGNRKDVVTIEDLPDELPSLTPAPPKKSRFKASRVTFEDEDATDRLDKHDSHISTVLSRIVERDTSCAPISLPVFTGLAFPKVLRRSETSSQVKTKNGREESTAVLLIPLVFCSPKPAVVSGPSLVSGEGLQGPDSSGDTMRIHLENQAKLQAMSTAEIQEEQRKLMSQLDPSLVEFIRSRKARSAVSSGSSSAQATEGSSEEDPQREAEDAEDLPVKPQKEWVHMDKLEHEKLEWMRDLPSPRKKGTKKAMQARFDFAGSLIPPTENLPTHLGLHHHGEEPERAGYSLQELFLLSRSQLIQQRSLALGTLANILSKARAGDYGSVLRGSVSSTLLDAGLLFLLRFALDDGVEGVMSAAVHALKALLVCTEDEECLDCTFSWFLGMGSFPMLPSSQEEEEDDEDEGLDEIMKETPKEKEEKKSDYEVTRQDLKADPKSVFQGLLKMKLLPRLRYVLEVVRPSPRVVQDVLQILTRIARHSSSSATQVLECPRLMETVMSEFLPTSWSSSPSLSPQSVYGHPLPSAMKLLRVIATSGRHACARLVIVINKLRLIAEPSELLLEQSEALGITAEAYRLWAVAAAYGQACSLYTDLYPALVRTLQSVHRLLPSSDPLASLQIQRLSALVSLLTQVTHTAGCHQELQAGVVSAQGGESPPPPPVSWSQVAGLQASLLGHVKGFIKNLNSLVQKDNSLALIPVYLVYLQTFYHHLSRQVLFPTSFCSLETLHELELLTSEVLLPLMRHSVVQGLMKNLRYARFTRDLTLTLYFSSVPLGPETTPNLPGLACPGWRNRPGLVASSSPFPLLTGLGLLLKTITGIHKGLSSQFADLLLSDPVIGYLRSCSQATPALSHARAWLLRHEHLLLFLLLRLAQRLPEVAKHSSLYHQVALVLLPWLLPGNEYLAHELLSTIIFNKDFISCPSPWSSSPCRPKTPSLSFAFTFAPWCTHFGSARTNAFCIVLAEERILRL
uniref:RNA polymerase II associated protein 1 n=1 Tax=Kryptolebias marmoratus TaxID=37003 RepID=A0A3Q3AD92_KRYMA